MKSRRIRASTQVRLMERGHVQSKSARGLKGGRRAPLRRSFEAAEAARLFLAGDEVAEPAGLGHIVPALDEAMQAERPGPLLECVHHVSFLVS